MPERVSQKRSLPRVLCSEEVQAAAPDVEWLAMPPFVVKGRTEPLTAYRPCSYGQARTAPLLRETLGREAELRLTDAFIENLRHGARGAVVLEGEAGIGKSTLAHDGMQKARSLGGIRCLVGRALAVECTTPYFVWREVFREMLGVTQEDDPLPLRDRIAAELTTQQELIPLLPLLSVVLPIHFPESEFTEQLVGESRAESTRKVLLGLLLLRAAVQPHLLVLEDAHWFDSASWSLLWPLCRAKALVVVLTTRTLTPPLPLEAERIFALRSTAIIKLGALSKEGAGAILQRRLGVSIPEELSTWVHERSSGNPFYIEQLLGALLERQVISLEGGQCRLCVELNKVALPDTLEGVVATRLDHLGAKEQLMLKVASVIGRIFGVDALEHVHTSACGPADLAPLLAAIERIEIAAPCKDNQSDYFFRHVILHEVTYGLLLVSQRRQLHRHVAAWYEERYRSDLSPYFALLAWHYGQADLPEFSLPYLEKAGEQALRAHATREAVSLLSQALTHLERARPTDTMTRARLLRQLGDAWHGRGDLQRAQDHIYQALVTMGNPVPSSTPILFFGVCLQVLRQTIRRILPRSSSVAGESDRLMEAARAYVRLSEVGYFFNQLLLMAYAVLLSVNVADRATPSVVLARGFATLGVLCAAVPLRMVARFYMKRAVAIARSLGDPDALSYALATSGLCRYGFGDLQEAQADFEESRTIAEEIANHRRLEESDGMLSKVLLGLGDLQRASKIRKSYAELARQNDHPQPRAWGLLGCFVDALSVGPVDETMCRWPEEAALIAQKYPLLGDQIYALGLCSVARRCRGDWQGAYQASDEAISIMEGSLPTTVYALEGYCGAVETAILLLCRDKKNLALGKLAKRGCRQLTRFSRVFPIARSRALLLVGGLHFVCGHFHRAITTTKRSLVAATHLGMPYDQARSHAQMALLLHDPEHERQVHELTTRMGAWQGWIRYLEQVP